jgi:hypothetical protein
MDGSFGRIPGYSSGDCAFSSLAGSKLLVTTHSQRKQIALQSIRAGSPAM